MPVSKAADHSSSVRVTPTPGGGQAEVTQYGPERLAAVDHVEELTPQLDW